MSRRDGWLGLWWPLALGLVMVAPFLYMVGVALGLWVAVGVGAGTGAYPFAWGRLHPEHFTAALGAAPFGRFFLNSAIFAVTVALGQVITSATAAYAFARLRFAGRDRLFRAYLATMLVPAVLLLLPRFLLISALGWVDTYQGLISTELVSVGGIFLLRQFFLAIPRDLEDAARLEGAGEWTIFRRVTLPLSRPALATLAILALADQWRSFFWPLVATRSTQMRVVEVGLASLHGVYDLNWPYQMAAATVSLLPLLMLFVVAQPLLLRPSVASVFPLALSGTRAAT